MKLLLLTLVVLLCSTQVLTLTCYTCGGASDPDCKTETVCPPTAQFCKTVESGGDITSRTCEALCSEETYGVSCCSTDLC
ncbi:lymphocyte antigen 6D-like [Acanthopagrus latus]|uniref:lymphocyte antigen 6D-like n=1 Tax=Acanthopagrus latus TaxID=8177 RepID=UPI00187BE733|nr:lymphocyte antigen 6D-like [Acanthopagrus latus]